MEPDDVEIRVVACLVEKQRTTPDQYPLTLNALRLACNQASNRDPVVDYDDATLRSALHRLTKRKWTTLASWSTARSVKYKHLLDAALRLSDSELAVLTVLMLRGPQTPGELRQRSERIYRFAPSEELEQTLEELIDRGLCAPLERRPGERGQRYEHLLASADDEGEDDWDGAGAYARAPSPPADPPSRPSAQSFLVDSSHAPVEDTTLADRVARLEDEMSTLRAELRDLHEELGG